TCQNTTPTSVKVAHGLVECVTAVHERAPFRRLNETRDNNTDEAEHAEALRKVEPSDGNDRDNGPYQGWTDKTGSTSSLDQQHKSQQREYDLGNDAEGNIDNHTGGCCGHGSAGNGGEARTHDIAANGRGRNEIANRLADPAHPKQALPVRAHRLREKHPPGAGIEK